MVEKKEWKEKGDRLTSSKKIVAMEKLKKGLTIDPIKED